ncbi:MAG: acetyl-CoA carboxylase carboxyl transferase subunit beta [Oscillospiraceae bacterium]|jgi:acetyl-CoA carboxylase carboxyl transferase subunit beta|nr:acetyl-CoA carboxylase carboxyl transferase subunit beta [Oscillospiraceae bacterium]
MPISPLFRKPKNELEKGGRHHPAHHDEADAEIAETCPECGHDNPVSELWDNLYVCRCGYNFRMTARQRIAFMTDENSFEELFGDVGSADFLGFPGYSDKLESMKKSTRESEAVVCGQAEIGGSACGVFVMEPYFMMGSMGSAVGERITRLFEHAAERSLPVVGCTVSGGARMQEGILSLMQMAKTCGAVKRHGEGGNLYLTVLTNPTTGGVTASFAMSGDIIIAEPGATVGFAGARLVEQTVRKKLPPGFQKAEELMEHGFADMIVRRSRQRQVISRLLEMHAGRKGWS